MYANDVLIKVIRKLDQGKIEMDLMWIHIHIWINLSFLHQSNQKCAKTSLLSLPTSI